MRQNTNSEANPERDFALPGLAQQPCLDYLATLRVPSRQRLISWIEALGNDANKDGDFTTRGADGRDWQVMILGPHAVVWWVDHAVREVKIVAIRPADE